MDTANWPQFRSHKIVRAVRIISTGSSPHGGLAAALESGENVVLDVDRCAQLRSAESGGYLVAYADGYVSFSPAKAFEEGYTAINAVGSPISDRPYPAFGDRSRPGEQAEGG